ncbi:MAG: PD-(D/E)XK nuclease-like domain-containing protein [Planctomycetota bacterium]|jgi:hypothetical protein|nr:PD-(D/E)XK nuclease-like domain-containing protein [Planctomycetota bacterium]
MTATNVIEPPPEVKDVDPPKAKKKKTPAMPPPPKWAIVEDEAVYHARAQAGLVMSSGMLKRFRDCPYHYHRLVTGQVKEKDRAAYRFGRAVHKIILEGIAPFNRAFAIGGPINPKTGKNYGVGTQAHDAWLAERGLSREHVIAEEEADTLIAMHRATRRHSKAMDLLSYGWPELVCRATMNDVPCQARFDWLTHDAAGNYVILDLKTTEDMTWFRSDAKRYQYLHQFAFYRSVFALAAGPPLAAFWCIAVEKKEPFRVGMWDVPESDLDAAATENRISLESYKDCLGADAWPTGYEEPRTLTFDTGA